MKDMKKLTPPPIEGRAETRDDWSTHWDKVYAGGGMAYPSEYVIRIFKGNYPKLNFDKNLYAKQSVLDVGAGDGRNLFLLHSCGLSCAGVEISNEIVAQININLEAAGVMDANIRTGNNANIPFDDRKFDYLLSWNSCYYMGDGRDFSLHVKEFAKALKPDGTLILSIPKKNCFIYEDCKSMIINNEQYALICKDPFKIRNGTTLRMFNSEEDIVNSFSTYFDDFIFASIDDDCFGYAYKWHLVVAKKKSS